VATRTRLRSTRLLVVALVSASLVIITLDYRGGSTGPLAAAGRSAKAGMAPLQEAVTDVTRPIGNFFSGLANLPTLAEENRRLTEELATARTDSQRFAFLQAQLQQLEDLLGLREQLDPEAVPAVVVASGVSNFDWTITINKGTDHGIALEMPVVAGVAGSPRLVGKVIEVTKLSAEVELLIDRDSAVAAVIEGVDEAGLVVGRGDEDPVILGIDPDTDLVGDENVFTQGYEVSGQPGVYPPGILIGQVARVSPAANSLQTDVAIRPAVDFSTLDYVLVLATRSRDTGADEEPAT
jgi:rod shape-determining protein MreC